MGFFDNLGKSTSSQTQNSTTAPWAPAQPFLNNVLNQANGQLGSTGVTANENDALNTIQNNSNAYSGQFGPQETKYAQSLLHGGGALNQAGAVNQNYQNYYNQTNPLASNTNYDPYSTPGLSNALSTLTGDITNQVNGSFAGAGRDFSGANQMALGRGLSSGLAPLILGQYNQNVSNQQGAAGNLYNAGNTNAGILAGMQQQYLANQGQGVTAAQQSLDTKNAGAQAALQAEAMRRGIPANQLGLLAQIGIPIAGLGSQSTGQSDTTSHSSPAQTFQQIASGVGSVFGGSSSAASNAAKAFSDRRLKEDITQVGALFDGTPVYRYRYIGQPAFQIGVMAQDVEKYAPEAVEQIGGFKAVDYKLATDRAVEAA